MTARELRALIGSGTLPNTEQGILHSGRSRIDDNPVATSPDSEGDLRAQLVAQQQLLKQKDQELEQLKSTKGELELELERTKENASNQASGLE